MFFTPHPCIGLSNCKLAVVDWQVGNAFLKIDTGASGSQMRQKYSRFVNGIRQ
jgi:hypothetical protein